MGHGSLQAPPIFVAIRLAYEAVDNQVLQRIHSRNLSEQCVL